MPMWLKPGNHYSHMLRLHDGRLLLTWTHRSNLIDDDGFGTGSRFPLTPEENRQHLELLRRVKKAQEEGGGLLTYVGGGGLAADAGGAVGGAGRGGGRRGLLLPESGATAQGGG